MMNIGIMPHTRKKAAIDLAGKLIETFRTKDVSLWLEQGAATLVGYPELGQPMAGLRDLDVLLVLGGDGALLNAARLVSTIGVPLLGINVGHLGFLTELEIEDVDLIIEKLLLDEYSLETRMMIEGKVLRDGVEVASYLALNDLVINRGTFARIINIRSFVDGQHIIDYIADGIIVATPTGSTAYSLSAGGPIIDPLLECMAVTPICPHTLASRSVVVPPTAVLSLQIDAMHEDVMLTVDGQLGFRLQSEDVVEIRKASSQASFVKLRGRNFYEILNSRLNSPKCTDGRNPDEST